MSSNTNPIPVADDVPGGGSKRSSCVRDLFIVAGLIAIVLCLYAQVQNHSFLDFDDTSYIVNNPAVSSGLNARSITWAFTRFHDGYWLPLTWLSYMAVEQVSSHNPVLHLVVNVLFHAINVVLIWLVLRSLTGRHYPSLVVAILFVVHPQHVESVAWIAERKDVLFLFFGLLSLWAYGKWAAGKWSLMYGASLVCYGLSLMCKPMLVTLPLILLFIDYWPLDRLRVDKAGKGFWGEFPWMRLIEKIPFVAMALASSIISYLGKQASGATQSAHDFPIQVRIANALLSYVKYLYHTVPGPGLNQLGAFYPYPRPGEMTIAMIVGSFVLMVLISLVCVRLAASRRYLIVGWFWFVVSLLPVIGLVQVGAQAMADRFIYFPAIGLYIAVVWLLFDLVAEMRFNAVRRQVAIGFGCLILLFMAHCTLYQISYWSNEGTLFRHAIEVTENNDLAEEKLGVYLAQRGDVTNALIHFLTAAKISPHFASAHHNAAMAYESMGDDRHAFEEYGAAIAVDPAFIDSYYNAGNLFFRLHRLDQAQQCYEQALRVRPDYIPAREALMLVKNARATGKP